MTTATNPRGPVFIRNRRRHARVDARGVATHLHTKDASAPGLAIENISMGGIFVRSASALPVGTRVMLQVVRPGLRRAIELTGHVASIVTPIEAGVRGLCAGMGISLDTVDTDTERRLRALVDELTMAAPAVLPAARPAATPTTRPQAAAPAPVAPAAPAAPVAPVTPAAPVAASPELAEAKARCEAQARRIAQLEAELGSLRKEMLRRNRTVGELANRLAAFERIRAAS